MTRWVFGLDCRLGPTDNWSQTITIALVPRNARHGYQVMSAPSHVGPSCGPLGNSASQVGPAMLERGPH